MDINKVLDEWSDKYFIPAIQFILANKKENIDSYRWPINADGDLSRSISGKVEGKSGASVLYISGNNYYINATRGTPPNSIKGTLNSFIDDLYEWLKHKKYDLVWSDELERQKIAERLARKIFEEGSYKHREGIEIDVVQLAWDETNHKLREVIGVYFQRTLKKQILQQYGDAIK